MNTADSERWLATANELADLARTLSMASFRLPLAVEFKGDGSPVTQVDRQVEQALRERLALVQPAHGIVGEELEALRPHAEFVWHLDPIDGTKSYVCGLPLWGTLIALLRNGVAVLGVIDAPAMDERWSALRGGAAWFTSARAPAQVCHTSPCVALAHARICMPAPDAFSTQERSRVQRLERAAAIRRHGGDCYAYGLLASGHLDVVVEAGLDPHDYLPMVPIIEAAGGVITDWQGRALDAHSAGDVLAAATATLHRDALAVLRQAG